MLERTHGPCFTISLRLQVAGHFTYMALATANHYVPHCHRRHYNHYCLFINPIPVPVHYLHLYLYLYLYPHSSSLLTSLLPHLLSPGTQMAATVAQSQPTGLVPPSAPSSAPSPAMSSIQSHLSQSHLSQAQAHGPSHHHHLHHNHHHHHPPSDASKTMPDPLPTTHRFQPNDFKLVRTLGTG